MSHNELIKVAFLDRDGVINHDPGDYTRSLKEFTILPGVVETLKSLSLVGYSIVVITNQGGIAKGQYLTSDFYEIDAYMRGVFSNAGIRFLETYFCPHHEEFSRCLCRKPGSGMLEKAIARHGIDPEASFMIGDKERDLQAAARAGVKGVKTDVNQDLRTVSLPI
jgi:D-glycero-D-manno-heptose 1,7-bisphosphate phosphatase